MKNTKHDRVQISSRHSAAVAVVAWLLLIVSGGTMSEGSIGPDNHAELQRVGADPREKAANRLYETSPIRPVTRSSAFHPSLALKSQLPELRAAADRGDAHAACFLAWALDLCERRSNHDRLLDYPDDYLARLDDTQAERVSIALNFRERRVSAMCADMKPGDAADIEERILQSALAGHPRSMSRFATLSSLPERYTVYSSTDFATAYRENAEAMINRAAEAGDLDAIASISFAYSSGYISSALGDLPIKGDRIKAMAAASAMWRIRGVAEKEKLPTAYVGGDDGRDQAARQLVRNRLVSASQDELIRFTRLESAYVDAYRQQAMGNSAAHGLLDDLPEQACPSVSSFGSRRIPVNTR